MGFGSWLLITALVIVVVIAAAVLITHLRGCLAKPLVNEAVVGEFAVGNRGVVGSPVGVGLNVPIYVVGPQTLVQELIGVGINQSLIRPIAINELPKLPSGSVVVIDWSLIKPGIVVGDASGGVLINLTSSVIHDLANAIAKGDIVGIYTNGSDEKLIEFTLAYSWAVATKHRLLLDLNVPSKDYLLAYPVIPVSRHEPVIIIVRRVGSGGLIIGPVYLNQLQTVIINIMKPTTTTTASNNADPSQQGVDPRDPCYAEYLEFEQEGYSNPALGIYVSGNGTLVWAAAMFSSASRYGDYGIQAYQDGNGTYYWDTCLAVNDLLAETNTGLPYFPINVLGYEDYYESSTMYNNYGYVSSQLGAIDYYSGYQLFKKGITNALVGDPGDGSFAADSWNPPSTSTSSYDVFLGGVPSITVGIDLPVGTSETIDDSLSPAMGITLYGSTIQVPNITWTFNIGYGANGQAFPNSFEDISPANVYIPNPSSSYIYAQFNVDFENSVVTAQYPCAYEIYQTIWVDTTWDVVIIPQSSDAVNLSQSSLLLNNVNAPSGTYITGITSYQVPIICGVS